MCVAMEGWINASGKRVFHSASAIGHFSNKLKETIAGACVDYSLKGSAHEMS